MNSQYGFVIYLWRRERDLNPWILADTSFPGWRSSRLSDPGNTDKV